MLRLFLILVVSVMLVCGAGAALAIWMGSSVPTGWLVTYANQTQSGYWTLRQIAVNRSMDVAFMPPDLFTNLPLISPDSRYALWRQPNRLSIYDSQLHRTHLLPAAYAAVWSPSLEGSAHLAFIQAGALFQVDLAPDGTLGSPMLLASEDYETVAAIWSPDGGRLVILGFSPATGLYTLSLCTLDGAPPRQLLSSHSRVNPPAWSEDGREIIYDVQEQGARHLYRLNLDDRRGGMIVTEDDWNAYPIPSPDGSYLAYLSDTNGFVSLYSLSMTERGAQPQILTLLTPDVGYVWSPEATRRRIAFINAADNDLYWTAVPNFPMAIPFPSFRLTDNDGYNVILK